jgi:hypothetical protein
MRVQGSLHWFHTACNEHGAQVYARIQSFIATTRKLKQNTFQELCNLLNGKTYSFQTT